MKNVVFWDIKPSSYLTGDTLTLGYRTSLLMPCKIDVFTAVIMKTAVFWDITSCGSCKNPRFGGTYLLHDQGDNRRARNKVSSPILVTLMM
jgi:hypothetical protein